jgi:hypothetical protein
MSNVVLIGTPGGPGYYVTGEKIATGTGYNTTGDIPGVLLNTARHLKVVAYAHGLGADTPVNQGYAGSCLGLDNYIYLVPYGQSNQTKWHKINATTGEVVAYAHGLGADTPVSSGYIEAILGLDDYIYLVPYGQSNQTKWHKINATTGEVVAYAHGLGADTPEGAAYQGGCLGLDDYIYLTPCFQASSAKWHKINSVTGAVVAYSHGLGADTPVSEGYEGSGCLGLDGYIYLPPYKQGNQTKWHKINATTGAVVAYAHGLGADSPGSWAYTRAVLGLDDYTTGVVVAYAHGLGSDTPVGNGYWGSSPRLADGNIYLSPWGQTVQSKWHKINSVTGIISAYTHNLGGDTPVSTGYRYNSSIGLDGYIYLNPCNQSNQTKWHKITWVSGPNAFPWIPDWMDNNVLSYWNNISSYITRKAALNYKGTYEAFAHGLGANKPVSGAYQGGVLGVDDYIYPIPYYQAVQDNYHRISSTGAWESFAHGLGANKPVMYGYIGGALGLDGYIYPSPFDQANQAIYHRISPTGVWESFAHGLGANKPVYQAYTNGVLGVDGYIYQVPNLQAQRDNYHRISPTGVWESFAHGLGANKPVSGAYCGGVLGIDGYIYGIPTEQAQQSNYHRISPTGTWESFAHGLGANKPVSECYLSGALGVDGYIYLIPYMQAQQDNYHRISPAGVWESFAHGLGANKPVNYAYTGGVLGLDGYIYPIPRSQSQQDNYHRISPTGVWESFAHGLSTKPVNGGYYGGVLDINGYINAIAYYQGGQTNYHRINMNARSLRSSDMCKNRLFNNM